MRSRIKANCEVCKKGFKVLDRRNLIPTTCISHLGLYEGETIPSFFLRYYPTSSFVLWLSAFSHLLTVSGSLPSKKPDQGESSQYLW